jgi:hypothetical protein
MTLLLTSIDALFTVSVCTEFADDALRVNSCALRKARVTATPP